MAMLAGVSAPVLLSTLPSASTSTAARYQERCKNNQAHDEFVGGKVGQVVIQIHGAPHIKRLAEKSLLL